MQRVSIQEALEMAALVESNPREADMVWGLPKLPPSIREGGASYNTNAYLNEYFAFICIHLKIKLFENKSRMKLIWKGVWREIHEMQMFDRINDRSIFSYLISVGPWLIVLLLCNYPEFAQGLGSRAVGCG